MAQPGEHDARPERDAFGRGGHHGEGDDRLQHRVGMQKVVADIHAIEAGGLSADGRL
jgi:hypothetical protein